MISETSSANASFRSTKSYRAANPNRASAPITISAPLPDSFRSTADHPPESFQHKREYMERFQRQTPEPKASPKRRSSIGADAFTGIRNSLMKKFTYLRRSSIVSDSAQRPPPSLWIDKTQSEQNLNKSDRKSKTPSWVRPASSSFHMNRCSTLPADPRRSSTSSEPPEYLSNRRGLYAATPGRTFICIKSRRPQEEGELKLRKGNFVEGTLFNAWSATVHCCWGCRP